MEIQTLGGQDDEKNLGENTLQNFYNVFLLILSDFIQEYASQLKRGFNSLFKEINHILE